MAMAKQVDWPGYAGLASALLNWQPQQFWQATPVEFFSALQAWQRHVLGPGTDDGATAQDLSRLTALFPDT